MKDKDNKIRDIVRTIGGLLFGLSFFAISWLWNTHPNFIENSLNGLSSILDQCASPWVIFLHLFLGTILLILAFLLIVSIILSPFIVAGVNPVKIIWDNCAKPGKNHKKKGEKETKVT